MKKWLTVSLAALLFWANCKQNEPKTSPTATKNDPQLAALFEAYYDENAQLFPILATVNGDNRFNDRLPNNQTQAFRDSLGRFYRKFQQKIATFDRAKLSPDDQTSYDIFTYEMGMALEGLTFPIWQVPTTQFEGLHLTLGQFGSGEGAQPFKTVKDYENWLARCASFPVWADSAIANYRLGMASGWTLPKACAVKMVPQCRDLSQKNVAKNLFYGPIKRLPDSFSKEDKARLTAAYSEMIAQKLAPAFGRLADFLEKEYVPKARTTSGVGAMPAFAGYPGGDKYYDWCIRSWTTVKGRTPDQIFETGKSEVARLRTEMERVKESTGFKGDLAAFFEFLKTDKQFMPFKNAGEVLDSFNRIYKIIQPNVDKMFTLKPKCGFEIRRTEAFREASASAEYNQGTPDGSRPGIFYVPVPDAAHFSTTSGMESLFLHEAIPGHHFQVMLQMEDAGLPKFRRFSWYGAYGEGWALYTESLGKELGLYTNPYQYMGALGDEIHRAIRLVVDVGMHAKGWTREEAIKYSLENEAMTEAGAIAEIERYMANPAQALSYKTGSMHIRELRAKYEKELGAKFKLSDFHDEILRGGCLPLDVLDKKMARWAAEMQRVKG